MGEEKPKTSPPAGVWPTIKPFVNGGASGMLATCVIQPIDMIKVLHQFLSEMFDFFLFCILIFLHSLECFNICWFGFRSWIVSVSDLHYILIFLWRVLNFLVSLAGSLLTSFDFLFWVGLSDCYSGFKSWVKCLLNFERVVSFLCFRLSL